MSKTVRQWLFENIDRYDSKREIVLACDGVLNTGTSYIYKMLKKDEDFIFFCNLWEALEILDGNVTKKSELCSHLEISNQKLNEYIDKYNIDRYFLTILKGSRKGIYFGNPIAINDLKTFIEEKVI